MVLRQGNCTPGNRLARKSNDCRLTVVTRENPPRCRRDYELAKNDLGPRSAGCYAAFRDTLSPRAFLYFLAVLLSFYRPCAITSDGLFERKIITTCHGDMCADKGTRVHRPRQASIESIK